MRPWEANIRKVVPYVPGDQPGGDKLIKLNTNENPYPPAPGAIRALRELETDRLRKYPDPAASMLVEALAGYYGVGSDQVFVGVGPSRRCQIPSGCLLPEVLLGSYGSDAVR